MQYTSIESGWMYHIYLSAVQLALEGDSGDLNFRHDRQGRAFLVHC